MLDKNKLNSRIEQLSSDYLLQLAKLYQEEIAELDDRNKAQEREIKHLEEMNEVLRKIISVYEAQAQVGTSLIEKFVPLQISRAKTSLKKETY